LLASAGAIPLLCQTMSRTRHTPADEPHFLVRTVSSAFANGSAILPHAHRWGQLTYAAAGVVTVWTDQGSWVAPPTWAVWAPHGIAHAMRFTGKTLLHTLYVRPGLRGQPERSSVVAVSPLLRELIVRATDVRMLDRRDAAHVAMTALILHELRAQPTPSLDLPQPKSAALRRVADRIAQDPGRPHRHGELARRYGVSVRTLERGFLAETGLSLGRWRRQARFLHALRCLGGGASVKHAAAEAGYLSPSAFIAAFRRALETTPGRYFGGA
jgi:AraC-like DNA-binding protein/quercetin dioxygenase-like cupin family protein